MGSYAIKRERAARNAAVVAGGGQLPRVVSDSPAAGQCTSERLGGIIVRCQGRTGSITVIGAVLTRANCRLALGERQLAERVTRCPCARLGTAEA